MFQLGPQCMTIGLKACILRDVPFSALYFPSYAHLKVGLVGWGRFDLLIDLVCRRHGLQQPLLHIHGWCHRRGTSCLSCDTHGYDQDSAPGFQLPKMGIFKSKLRFFYQVLPKPGQTTYTGVIDAIQKISRYWLGWSRVMTQVWLKKYNLSREEGWKAFWKGGIPRKMRSSPQFGITLVAYELVQRMLFIDFGGSRWTQGSMREVSKANFQAIRIPEGGNALRGCFRQQGSCWGLCRCKVTSPCTLS